MSATPPADIPVVVIGGGVVGCGVAHALARQGVPALLLEAEHDLASEASGTNSGILHSGFDSKPGELETEMILRSAHLREEALKALSVPVVRCGAVLAARNEQESETLRALARNAARNGVETGVDADGALRVPGEWVTDPVAYTKALAAAAVAGGAELRLGARVEAIEARSDRLRLATDRGDSFSCQAIVNAGGLRADEVATAAGDRTFEIYPRKGEFFVFDPPDGDPLAQITLPMPTERTKGVLVFPSIDGMVIAGPTAIDGSDKDDWSVRAEAWEEVMGKVVRACPPLDGADPVASYAGLRPAGRGVNYVIAESTAHPALLHVAAIRSTGVSAALGIGEYVTRRLGERGISLGPERLLEAPPPSPDREPWWQRAARRSQVVR